MHVYQILWKYPESYVKTNLPVFLNLLALLLLPSSETRTSLLRSYVSATREAPCGYNKAFFNTEVKKNVF